MSGEVRKRKNVGKSEEKEKSVEKNEKSVLPVEQKSSKLYLLWYLISPMFAVAFTLKADVLLDQAISKTENRIRLQKEKIDEINRLWSPEIASDYLAKFEDLRTTIDDMEVKIKDFGDNVFAKYEDPFVIMENVKKLLQEVKEIKATEDTYYRALRAAKKEESKNKVPGFMELMERHTAGLGKNLKLFREVHDEHEKALKEHDLTSIYVNLTEPIEQLRDEITDIVETCRDIGSNRFITESFLGDLNVRLKILMEKVDGGVLDGAASWQDPEGIEKLAQDVYGLEGELGEFSEFAQQIRDNYEQTLRNDKRARHAEIEIDEKYKTPEEYKKMFKNLARWHNQPDMQQLVGMARKVARKANELLKVDCEERQRDLIQIYYDEIAQQEKQIDIMTKYLNETDLYGVFQEVVVDDIIQKQVGLTRFINQMRFQIAKAEEHWATLYYEYLQTQKSELSPDENQQEAIEIVEDVEILEQLQKIEDSPIPLEINDDEEAMKLN